VKRLFLLCLLVAGCGGENAVAKAWRSTTNFHRPAFDNPGDALALSPSIDSGPFGTDPNADCSSCPPR
jgi:hypothetical protein